MREECGLSSVIGRISQTQTTHEKKEIRLRPGDRRSHVKEDHKTNIRPAKGESDLKIGHQDHQIIKRRTSDAIKDITILNIATTLKTCNITLQRTSDPNKDNIRH